MTFKSLKENKPDCRALRMSCWSAAELTIFSICFFNKIHNKYTHNTTISNKTNLLSCSVYTRVIYRLLVLLIQALKGFSLLIMQISSTYHTTSSLNSTFYFQFEMQRSPTFWVAFLLYKCTIKNTTFLVFIIMLTLCTFLQLKINIILIFILNT